MSAGSSKRKSIKAVAKRRQVRRTYYDMVVGDGDLAALAAALDDAKSLVRATKIMSGTDEERAERVALAEAGVEKARAALDEHRERIWFEPIPAQELELLRLKHPDESEVSPGALWSFIPALVAACAVDYDDTAEDWAEEIRGWSSGERNAIWREVWSCNREPASLNLGKD